MSYVWPESKVRQSNQHIKYFLVRNIKTDYPHRLRSNLVNKIQSSLCAIQG